MTAAPDMPDVSFNPFEPGFFDDPYQQYALLREHDPVHRSPLEVVILFRHRDVIELLRNPALSVEPESATPTARMVQLMEATGGRSERGSKSMLSTDPPDHTRLRRLVSKAFTPRMIEGLRPRVQELVDELLVQLAADAADGDGIVDVIGGLAFPLPFTVITEMLGMPDGDRDQLRSWAHTLAKTLDPIISDDDVAAAMEAGDNMLAHIQEALAWKRQRPADDLLTGLLAAEEEGDRLTEQELIDQVILLYIAGHETTVNLIGNGLLALLRHRDQLELVRDDPSLDQAAVEELLRYDSPVQFSRRIPTADLEIGGTTIEAGRFVLTALGSANRDPDCFGPTADRLDVTRADAGHHVSFGSGVHHCLGAHLARTEARVAIGSLLRRFPGLDLAADGPVRSTRVVLRGLERLPLTL